MSGFRPRKRFGQNFLRDPAVIDRIVQAAMPLPKNHFVEIGPGEGVLTQALLPHCGILDAVEIDRDLAILLQRRFASEARFRLHTADALTFDFRRLHESGKLRIVGNLPYNISTPLLFHLFEYTDVIQDMHFMLQDEVVDRLVASPGSTDYGRLGIMARYHCQAEKLFEVGPESFYPRPKVVSAIVQLIPHATPPVEARREDLGRVVTAAFSQRRKTLRNSLKSMFEESEIRALGLDPGARAETLSLEDYARLARHWAEKNVAGHRA